MTHPPTRTLLLLQGLLLVCACSGKEESVTPAADTETPTVTGMQDGGGPGADADSGAANPSGPVQGAGQKVTQWADRLPLDLLPADTLALVAAPSGEALGAALDEVLTLFGNAPPAPIDPYQVMAMAGLEGDLSLIDRSRPLVLVLHGDSVPSAAFLVPVEQPEAFAASLGGAPVHLERGYALVGAEPGDGSKPFVEVLPSGLIVARMDLARLTPLIAPLLQQALSMAAADVPPDPGQGMDPAAVLTTMGEMGIEFLEATETLDLVLSWREGKVNLDGHLSLRPDSEFAAWIGEQPTGAGQLAGALDPEAAMQFVGGFDPLVTKDRIIPWVQRMFAMYPQQIRDALNESVAQMQAHYEHMGSGFAGTQDFTEQGLRYTYVFAPDDPAAMVQTTLEMFRSPGLALLGYKTGESTTTVVDGITLTSLPLEIDLEAMLAGLSSAPGSASDRASDRASDQAAFEQAERMMAGLFGPDARLYLGSDDKYLAMSLGVEGEAQRTLRRARAGNPPPPHLAALLQAHGDGNPFLVARIDFARLIGGAWTVIGPTAPEEAPQLPPDLEVSLQLYCAGRNDRVDFGLSLDLASLARMVAALKH
jgi:hypothetical protein